jgi:hypothetical protein
MPILPDPSTFSDNQLSAKPILFIGQYTHDSSASVPTMSTHVALSKVTGTRVSKTWDGCMSPSPSAYCEFTLAVSRTGPSGSGLYDVKSGKTRLVGIFSKGFGAMKYFLPLDKIYADTATCTGSAKQGGTIGARMRAIYNQRVKDGMPQL